MWCPDVFIQVGAAAVWRLDYPDVLVVVLCYCRWCPGVSIQVGTAMGRGLKQAAAGGRWALMYSRGGLTCECGVPTDAYYRQIEMGRSANITSLWVGAKQEATFSTSLLGGVA